MTGTVFCFAELGFLAEMGCGGSKVDDSALVVRCKERKEFIMAAADHRYALAAAHVSYFKSLESVGDALRKFVQEELLIASPPPSPVLRLPSDEVKPKKKGHVNASTSKSSPSPTSLSHTASGSGSGSNSHIHSLGGHDHDHDGSHLHLSDSDSELSSPSVHLPHHNHPPEESMPPFSGGFPQTDWGPYGINFPNSDFSPFDINPNPAPSWESSGMNPYPPLQPGWDPYNNYGNGMNSTNYHTYYMKKSATAAQTVIHDPNNSNESVQLPESSYMYPTSYSSYPYQNGGDFFRFPTGAPSPSSNRNKPPSPLPEPPPPPSPNVSSWDFLNPFDTFDHGYAAGYYSQNNIYENSSIVSSPEINEVREREGIPDLEDETDPEVIKEVVLKKGKKVYGDVRKRSGEGTTSRSVQSRKKSSESSSSSMPFHKQSSHGFPSESLSEGISVEPSSLHSESTHSVNLKEEKSSPEAILSKSSDDISTKKREVTFDDGIQDTSSTFNADIYRVHGTRDLNDVVQEIENEFKTASAVGKEVASMLEVGKLSYQPRVSLLKVILSRVKYLIAPTISYSTDPPFRRSVSTRLAESYLEDSENTKTINLSSTLDKLYVWEKKLYKEVKDEERLRLIYEKQCRRLKSLDDEGAESSKIEATQASIQKLVMKIDVCIKAVNAISRRIHKLRDEELQPQVTELVHGLIRMWRGMLNCHQKQFQAIMNSKIKKLRSNTLRSDSSLKATMELEVELRTWCNHLCDWMNNQRSFIVSLNAWLLRCLDYEPEESSDGIVPFSPGRIGAPPIFVICNDWFQAMETISEKGVAEAVDKFGSILRQLWATDENIDRKREESLKELERRLHSVRLDKKRKSDVPSESGILPLDDLKVDLDSMRMKLQEERANAGSSSSSKISLQANLVPIFECLGKFTSEAVKAYENVRTPNAK